MDGWVDGWMDGWIWIYFKELDHAIRRLASLKSVGSDQLETQGVNAVLRQIFFLLQETSVFILKAFN